MAKSSSSSIQFGRLLLYSLPPPPPPILLLAFERVISLFSPGMSSPLFVARWKDVGIAIHGVVKREKKRTCNKKDIIVAADVKFICELIHGHLKLQRSMANQAYTSRLRICKIRLYSFVEMMHNCPDKLTYICLLSCCRIVSDFGGSACLFARLPTCYGCLACISNQVA